jgi:hypothetical protein
LVAGLVLLAALALAGLANTGTGTTQYGFDASIVPEQNSPGIYQAKFAVVNLGNGKTLVAPTLRFRAGEPVSSSAVAESGDSFDFSVSVDSSASSAQYEVKVKNGSSVVSRTQARIALGK